LYHIALAWDTENATQVTFASSPEIKVVEEWVPGVNADTGQLLWRVKKEVWRSVAMDSHHGGVVLVDGCLYGSSCFYNKSQWVCLDWAKGR